MDVDVQSLTRQLSGRVQRLGMSCSTFLSGIHLHSISNGCQSKALAAFLILPFTIALDLFAGVTIDH